jgi:DNA anti-recombination protein RmuC
MAESSETRTEYLRGVVEALQREVVQVREGMQVNSTALKQDLANQEARLQRAIVDSEARTAQRFESVTKAMTEQNTHLRETLNQNNQQWLAALKGTQDQFTQTTKVLEEKYQTLMPFKDTVLKIIGALILLGIFAKPIIDFFFTKKP